MATTLITGGTVVNATGRGAADVLIDGEKIVALLTPGSTLLGTDLAASVDFVVQYAGENPLDQYALWHDKAAGSCAIDYGFHQILSDVQDSSLQAMDELVAEGVSSFKLFMAYKGVFLSDCLLYTS